MLLALQNRLTTQKLEHSYKFLSGRDIGPKSKSVA
jgi:hypothetical protein